MKDLKDKFIVAYDTIVDGHQCATDDNGKPSPELHDSEADAYFELFGDALSMIENLSTAERKEHGISPAKFKAMKAVFNDGNGDPMDMKDFLDQNPECNYLDEFVIAADEFVFGRKAIFTGNGGYIEGKKLTEF